MDALELLMSSVLFSELSKPHLESIAHLTEVKNFAPDELLFREGDDSDYCYLINSGRIELFREVRLQKKMIIAEKKKGDVLGELSLIDGFPRSASAAALEPTQTLALSKKEFNVLLKKHPEMSIELLSIVISHLRKANDDLYIASFLLT